MTAHLDRLDRWSPVGAVTMVELGIRHLVVERPDGELGITSIRDLLDALLAEDE